MIQFMNSDEFLQNQLKLASDYTGLPLHLNTWSPGDGFTRFTLADNEDFELSRALTRGEMAEVLLSLNKLYARIHMLKQRRLDELQEDRKRGRRTRIT